MVSTNIDTIVDINEVEVITTSIETYFKRVAIVAEFENAALLDSHVFDIDGYEEYESLAAVGVVFPTNHIVYKLAQDVFAQKANTGMNKSSLEKLIVIQIKSTDSSFETGLTRIGFADAYHFVCGSFVADDIESFVSYLSDKKKMPHAQTADADVLTDTAGNIAETLADANSKCMLYYHSDSTEGLHAAMASIHCFSTPGRISGFYDKPTGITADTLTDAQKGKLDGNYVNYYVPYIWQTNNIGARTLTAGGYMTNGDLVQARVILDRIEMNLQSASMDAFEMKVPYSDKGGTVLEGKLKAVLRQVQTEGLIDDDIADSEGVQKGQEIKVLTIKETQTDYASYYAEQKYVAQAKFRIVVNGRSVVINITYSL